MRRWPLLALTLLLSAPLAAEAPQGAAKGAVVRESTLLDLPSEPRPENLLWLRWRAPGAFIGGLDQVNGFARAYTPVAGIGAFGFGVEPGAGLSPMLPTVGLFGPRDPVQLQLGVLESRLGNGTLLADFTTAPLGGARAPGLDVEGRLAGAGAQLIVADLLAPRRLVAARAHARPLLFALAPEAALLQADGVGADPATEALGALVIGASFAADASAPGALTGEVSAYGVDAALRLLDLRELQLGARLDLNSLAGAGGGAAGFGAHAGVTAAAHLGAVDLAVDVEGYSGTEGYVPRYFDRPYLVEREALHADGRAKATVPLAPSLGARLRLNAAVLGLVTARLELDERRTELARDGRVSLGLHTLVPLGLVSMGGGLSVSQTDVNALATGEVFAPGFVLLAQGRLASFLDVVHVTTDLWVVHAALAPPTRWEVGVKLGLEVRFGLL